MELSKGGKCEACGQGASCLYGGDDCFEPGECLADAVGDDPRVGYAVMLSNFFEKGIPPVAGGVGDQPNWDLEALNVINTWAQLQRETKAKK